MAGDHGCVAGIFPGKTGFTSTHTTFEKETAEITNERTLENFIQVRGISGVKEPLIRCIITASFPLLSGQLTYETSLVARIGRTTGF